MDVVLKGKPDEPIATPSGIVALTIDKVSGYPAHDGFGSQLEYFIKGTEPTGQSAIYQKLELSRHQQGKLASPSEVSAGDYDTKDYVVLKENDPISTDGKNRWQDGINAWIKQTYAADHPEYYPPTDTSDYQESTSNNNPTGTPAPADTPTPTPN